MEIKIVAAVIQSKEKWEMVSPHISDDELTPEGILVWSKIREFYSRDQAASACDMEILERRVIRHVEMNAKNKASMEAYMQRIKLVDVSAINTVAEVLEHKRTLKEVALADALLARHQDQITELMEELSALNAAVDLDIGVDETHEDTDVSILLDAFDKSNLIGVSPPSLNDRLGGGALKGNHILVAATPETGKTLFALQMTAGFVAQGKKVLYIGNEDPIVAIVFRFLSNLSGMSRNAVEDNPARALELARNRGYSNAVFVGLSPGTLYEIRSLIVKYKPDVLVVDQLRNIKVKSENRTNQLEAVARGMRDFARQYQLVAVSITQAADSARNKLHLDMGDIDGSNIGIPGACDVMVMIGMNQQYYEDDERAVSLAKNKLTGNHDMWVIGVDKALSRVRDSGTYLKRPEVSR